MNATLKNIVARTYKPLLVKYLSKTRIFRHGNIRLEIPPQVFHPGFFFSTSLLLEQIRSVPLDGVRLLELGAGNGLISIFAAKKGAKVLASDINPVAVEFLHKNAERNKTSFEIVHSNLFREIPAQNFDIIAINPPYYKKNPVTPIDYAWYCGENGEYFSDLFEQLPAFVNPSTKVWMVLCDGCDGNMIEEMATRNGFRLHCLVTRKNILERNFLFSIEKIT